MPEIIAGVDGSEHSRRTVEWVMNEAEARHAPHTAISVHHRGAASHLAGDPGQWPDAGERG